MQHTGIVTVGILFSTMFSEGMLKRREKKVCDAAVLDYVLLDMSPCQIK